MLVDEVRAEKLAEVFHHFHQKLSDDSTFENPAEPAVPVDEWRELPVREKNRMIDAARLTLLELDSERNRRKYFAKPGEAEWGC